MMKKTKKNNKGFSLVELIVVILIMAIIAVALAPQVMKWVDKSRQSKDASNYDSLFAAAQIAVVAAPAEKDKDITITMATSGTTVATVAGGSTADFETAMNSALPDWKSIAITSKEKTTAYTIVISGSQVKRGSNAPGEISATD